ncbi:MAG: CinA family protein [Eubacteriales bacterium]|nr:CinA family protein [Eubacteriales bacterium]
MDENYQTGIEEKLVSLLVEKNIIVTTAESCTGGMIASSIVNVSGASAIFKQGYITYCDEAKTSMLGVKKDTLDKFKAVSSEVACEMADGARIKSGADVAVSVTGVAGPSMEDGKPVGLVYIGIADKNYVFARKYNFTGDRMMIRTNACKSALELLYEYIE